MARKKEALSIRAIFVACLLFPLTSYAAGSIEPECTLGNFALPVSQQPGPLVSFGQNIIDQNQLQLYLLADDSIGHKQHCIDVAPNLIYGITDNFSLFFNVPFAASYRDHQNRSSGIEDLFLQLEWAFYTGEGACFTNQATLVFNASFPTGSSHKDPPTGLSSMAYFLGATYNYTGENWFCFTSYGAQIPVTTRFGNDYLYQFGVGRNIANPGGWMLAWLIEIDGTFVAKGKTVGKTNLSSGGNVVYLTPSLWASSAKWIIQFGVGYAVEQNRFRDQYSAILNIGWTFF